MIDPDAGRGKHRQRKATRYRGPIGEKKGGSREERSASLWVTGRHPVEELLASVTQRARKVLLSEAVPKEVRAGFEQRAKELALPCHTCPRPEWERRTGEREGGGIAAEIAEYAYAEIEGWISGLPETARVFLLDGITDPQNLGAIVLGSEEKGIRRLARERCDGAVRIPMDPGAESLNVSVAAGIIAYSIRKSLTSPSG